MPPQEDTAILTSHVVTEEALPPYGGEREATVLEDRMEGGEVKPSMEE